MATIASLPILQGQYQQVQPSDSFVGTQAQQSAANTTRAQDPLFEALAKYITSGPGPSPVSDSEIQEIINNHANQQGGREWLEAICAPIINPPQPIRWKNHATATGFLSTNIGSLTLYFTATRNMIFQKLKFRGTCSGFFPPQVFTFEENAKFYWNDLADKTPARIEVEMLSNVSILTVRFYNAANELIGELLVTEATANLPPYPIPGEGLFTFPDGPQ